MATYRTVLRRVRIKKEHALKGNEQYLKNIDQRNVILVSTFPVMQIGKRIKHQNRIMNFQIERYMKITNVRRSINNNE